MKNDFLKLLRFAVPFLIALAVSLLFILLCIYPALPVIGLYLNGGLLGIIREIFFGENSKNDKSIQIVNWIFNFGLTTYFFILFIVSSKTWAKAFFSFLSILFLFYFILFGFMDKFEGSVSESLFFVIQSLITCILFIVAVIVQYIFSRKP